MLSSNFLKMIYFRFQMKTTVRAMGEDKEFNCIKIVVVGDVRCGKTSLIHRFINDKFPEVFIL
jgi:GTPase SAR1 family protein